MGHKVSLENVKDYFIKTKFPNINTTKIEVNNRKVIKFVGCSKAKLRR